MNLPNIITLGRLLAVPIIIWLILNNNMNKAFFIFIIGSISDAIDGSIARAMKKKTILGSYLDPIADKLLVIAVYLTLSYKNYIPCWLSITVVLRDLLIIKSSILLKFFNNNFQIKPLKISKINTTLQLTYISWILAYSSFPLIFIWKIDIILIVCVTLTTYVSSFKYIKIYYKYLINYE